MITLFYTHRLRGDLEAVPRLFTMLKALRGAAGGGAILYVDVGESCAREVWHCAVTGGRSALFALDAMGCDAANAEAIHPQNRAKVQETVTMRLIAKGDSQVIKGMRILTSPSVPQPPQHDSPDSPLPACVGEGSGVRGIDEESNANFLPLSPLAWGQRARAFDQAQGVRTSDQAQADANLLPLSPLAWERGAGGEGQEMRSSLPIRAVSLTPATQTFAYGGILYLAGLEAAQIGVVQIADGILTDAAIQDVPADTPPDPTIVGAVEFILAEAHYILKKARGRG